MAEPTPPEIATLGMEQDRFGRERETMVRRQLRDRGVVDERVLEAMAQVPRERFVPEHLQAAAYHDGALPIGFAQTISQPVMVAIMLEALRLQGHERVLDIGTGSGYQAALLGLLARDVSSVEIVPELAARARRALRSVGIDNVRVIDGDGSIGFPEGAPYDAIVVAAASPSVPAPLVEQLLPGGRLVLPVGEVARGQILYRVWKRGGQVLTENLGGCIFVPLVGEHGW